MKTKLFSLFIAVFLFSIGSNAQATSCTPGLYNCISLIGPGTPGGNWDDDSYLSTTDGNVYTGLDWQFSAGDIKFRANSCWETACTIPGINVNGWGPVSSSETGWPSGTNVSPVSNGANIKCPGGVYNVKFTLSTNSWEFTPGTPNPVIKLIGTAAGTPKEMSTINGVNYTLKKVPLVVGTCQFDINNPPTNTGIVGGTTFPDGTVTGPTDFITVDTAIDYDVTFNYSTGEYTFAVATFPIIDIIGNGTTGTQAGWSAGIDLTTTDGVTYTIKNLKLYATSSDSDPVNGAAGVKFRLNNNWGTNWGGKSFPTGPIAGNNDDIMVTATGTYNVTFNKTTGEYAFSFPEIGLIGSGTTGTDAGWSADIAKMATIDGENYTLTQQLYSVNTSDSSPGKVKFRTYGAWIQDWGGTSFPTGPIAGNNSDIVVTTAGTYAIKFNRLTGAYDFGTTLGVNKFDVSSFKAYPNPTRGSWNITSGNDDITSLQVYDVQGRAVYTKFGASKEVNVNASELSKGVYFAKVSTANGSSTLKLVKE